MKSIFPAVTIFLLTISAYSNVYAEDYILGAVNTARLLSESPQAETLRSQIEKEFAPRDRQLLADQKKLKDMEDRLTKDAAIMSETERKKLERDIITLRRDLKRNQDEFREDLTFRRNEELTKLQKDIGEAITAIAKEHKLDLVLTEQAAVFVSSKMDITNLVIDYLKNKGARPAQ
jgi:outer membrane protein